MSTSFKNLGINRDLLFEQIEEAVWNITHTLDHVENTLNSITPENKIDDFDLLSLQEGLDLNREKFKAVKQAFRRSGGYEELLYAAVKSMNSLIKGVGVSASLHNALILFYSKQEEVTTGGDADEAPEVPQEEIPVKPRGRGRPARGAKRVAVQKVAPVSTRTLLTGLLPVVFLQEEIKVNTLLRSGERPVEQCQECEVALVETEEKGILECPTCGAQSFQEAESGRQEHTVVQATETKHKRGGDQRFVELTQSIQGKLTIRDKDRELVEEAIAEARKAFPHGAEDYNDINAWLRGTKVKSSAAPKGVKKYDTIYKYAPHIYSKVTGFELSSFTDREFSMIEKVYSYISSNFRELHCRLVSNQSTKSIKAEFFVDRLIDLYVTDVRRQRALKAVIARKTSESNAGNELIWKHVKEEYIKA